MLWQLNASLLYCLCLRRNLYTTGLDDIKAISPGVSVALLGIYAVFVQRSWHLPTTNIRVALFGVGPLLIPLLLLARGWSKVSCFCKSCRRLWREFCLCVHLSQWHQGRERESNAAAGCGRSLLFPLYP